MNESSIRKHSTIKLLLKGVSALIALVWLLMLLSSVILVISENGDNASKADLIRWCDGSYYDRDYAGLYDTLTLYDLYDEDFAHYWEAVDRYQAYAKYKQWTQAGDESKAQRAKEQLQKLAVAPKFPQNSTLLKQLYARLDEDA